MKNTVTKKKSREELDGKLSSARLTLLLIIIFTIVNLILLLTKSDRYFLFSSSVPYYLTAFAMGMDEGVGGNMFTIIALVISALILAAYFICWLQSKYFIVCQIVALALFVVDTILLVVISGGLDMLRNNIIDLLFHGWAVVELSLAVVAHRKLKALPLELEEESALTE